MRFFLNETKHCSTNICSILLIKFYFLSDLNSLFCVFWYTFGAPCVLRMITLIFFTFKVQLIHSKNQMYGNGGRTISQTFVLCVCVSVLVVYDRTYQITIMEWKSLSKMASVACTTEQTERSSRLCGVKITSATHTHALCCWQKSQRATLRRRILCNSPLSREFYIILFLLALRVQNRKFSIYH